MVTVSCAPWCLNAWEQGVASGWETIRPGSLRCAAYVLCTDFILPALHSPHTYVKSPLLGAPAQNRTYLAIFKGRMQVRQGRRRGWLGLHRQHVLATDRQPGTLGT